MGARGELIALRGIGRAFADGTRALDSIGLSVRDGDFLALVGPSGCGKSTLLRLIAGLDEQSEGTMAWPSGRPDKGGVGFVFQDATLMPWADAFDNVFLPFRLAGRTRAETRETIMSMLDRVGLAGFERAYPRQLSGGMRMRVSLARALVTRPRLLLMDEPFAAVDELTRFRLNDDLLALWREAGCTVVFVTHSVFEAVYLSTRIAVMSARPGRIVADEPVDLPYPRTPELRTSPPYAERCRAVSAHLAVAAS